MNKILFAIIVALMTGCVASSVEVRPDHDTSTRRRIIHIAEGELKRQNATLPHDYDVVVEDAEAGNELEPSRKVYQVSFSFAYHGKKQLIYTVIINTAGKVEVFSDSRTSVPSKV